MDKLPFKTYFFKRFQDWEDQQPGGRSTYTAYADYLSQNSYAIVIKQQLVSDWIRGKYKPSEDKYLVVLEEKLGREIYKILEVDRPNPLRLYATRNWDNVPTDKQLQLAETIAKYSTEPLPDESNQNTTPKQK